MNPESNYSLLDRWLHRLAFSGSAVQMTAADIERTLYGNRFRHIRVRNPIFITSLPRAGTTLMLEMLTGASLLATHCYRDMPFVLAPVLWDSLSQAFRKPAHLTERAHGDGMMVGYDSPEAFEEVLWRTFWPAKFEGQRIAVWAAGEEADEFRDAFHEHIQKLIALRSTGEAELRRYVSKNNANIARLDFLKQLFPDALIVIPFRHPAAQAQSLFRQHTRFLSRHIQDPFAKRYMRDIGHLEFGELHQPIVFDGMDDVLERYRPETLDYWMAYWTRAFDQVLRHHNDVLFVSYENFCQKGLAALRVITKHLDLQYDERRAATMAAFHEPRDFTPEADTASPGLVDCATALHRQLMARSIV